MFSTIYTLSIKCNSVYAAWAFKESCIPYFNTQCSLSRVCLGRVCAFPTVTKAMRRIINEDALGENLPRTLSKFLLSATFFFLSIFTSNHQ